jgi:putative transposase
MPEYRRAFRPCGTFFFTVVTHHRRRAFCSPIARRLLRSAIEQVRKERPFQIDAFVLLPEHLHTLWTMPPEDSDFSTRWGLIKSAFTKGFLSTGGREAATTRSRAGRRERGVWQPRLWEHTIRDEEDLERHMDYIHYNPVKHDLAPCPHAWPYSTFPKHVTLKRYTPDWQCICGGGVVKPPAFDNLAGSAME